MKSLIIYVLLAFLIALFPQLNLSAETNIVLYKVQDDNTALRPEPYKDSGIVESLCADTIVACTETVTNDFGNIWMKTLSGNYIYSERLTECPLRQDGIYSFKNLDSQLYLNLDINHIQQISNHTRLTSFKYDPSSLKTQLFRIHFVSDYQALILAVDNSNSYAINVTYNNIAGSRAEVYHTSLNVEPWIIHSPSKYNYEFSLASNNTMFLTAQGDMQNIVINTAKDCLQLWYLQAANVDTSISFTPNRNAPDLNSFYYSPPTNCFPFKNGNCCWYVYGRANEILGYKPDFNGNAKSFWDYRNSPLYYGYSETTPKRGSVAVWSNINFGHVAIVEEIYPDGSILVSESSYGGYNDGSYFKTRLYSSIDNMKTIYDADNNPLSLLGFIYLLPE